MTTTDTDRSVFKVHLSGAAHDFEYALNAFNKERADLGRRAQQMAENANVSSAMSDLAFVQAYMNGTVEARARLATAIEKLKLVHFIGKEVFALTAEEFTAATRLNAETYEKAAAK